MITHNNLVECLRPVLRERNMVGAEAALDYAGSLHTGRRRDGNPEISHQVEIARYLLRMPIFPRREIAITIAFLHDVREDHGVADCVIRALFGSVVAGAVGRLTKSFRGVDIPDKTAFQMPLECPLAAIVKGADRIHNLRTMDGAFSPAKQCEYRLETRTLILPMLRKARALHPLYAPVLTRIILDLIALSGVHLDQIDIPERIPHEA